MTYNKLSLVALPIIVAAVASTMADKQPDYASHNSRNELAELFREIGSFSYLGGARPTGQTTHQTGDGQRATYTYQAYDGPTRPLEQVAVLNFSGPTNCGGKHPHCGPKQTLFITSVDSVEVRDKNSDGTPREGCEIVRRSARYPLAPKEGLLWCKHQIDSIQLLPGKHTIHFFGIYPTWTGTNCNFWHQVPGRGQRTWRVCEFNEVMTVTAGRRYRAELNSRTTQSASQVDLFGGGIRTQTFSEGIMWVEVTEMNPDAK